MAKNKGGRSKNDHNINISPHPRQSLKELRELGASEADIRYFREQSKLYNTVLPNIRAFNKSHNVLSTTENISYESAIKLVRGGRTLRQVANELKEHRRYYENTGTTKDYNDALFDEIDFVNRECGIEVLNEDIIRSLNEHQRNTLQSYIQMLHRYVDNRDYYSSIGYAPETRFMEFYIEEICNDIQILLESVVI